MSAKNQKESSDDEIIQSLCFQNEDLLTKNGDLLLILEELAPWASAAMDDPKVCPELKAIFQKVLEATDDRIRAKNDKRGIL